MAWRKNPASLLNAAARSIDDAAGHRGRGRWPAWPQPRLAAGFFGTDLSVRKTFDFTERLKFQIGFNARNFLKHTNYGTPSPNSSGSEGSFGNTVFTATMPTSPYGALLAAATDQRTCQIQGKLIF
jgi:hypothetical protein